MQPFGLMNYAETHELTPKYINIRVNGNNEQSLNTGKQPLNIDWIRNSNFFIRKDKTEWKVV